jgi:alginate O-acetyltransferase complex protein AlgJ
VTATQAHPTRQAPVSGDDRRWRRRPDVGRRTLSTLLAALFFFAPAVAAGVGVRAGQIENHPLAAFPHPDRGWRFFADLTTWATDHLPLRGDAVRANVWASRSVFGEVPPSRTVAGGGPSGTAATAGLGTPPQPSVPDQPPETVDVPAVIVGKADWLYYGVDVKNACASGPPVELRERLARLADIVQRSGRTFVVAIAPDKSSADPQFLPADYPGRACSLARKRAFWAELESQPVPGLLDLRGPLHQAEVADGAPIYWPHDTHWTEAGSLVFAQELARRLDPGLLATPVARPGPAATAVGDLSVMLASPVKDTGPGFVSDRPAAGQSAKVGSSAAPGKTPTVRYQPRTVLVGDSFAATSATLWQPLFADYVPPAADVPGMVAAMTAAQTVVVEAVERNVLAAAAPWMNPTFLDRLQVELPAVRPAR